MMDTTTHAQPSVSKLEELLNIFGNTCYQLGLQKDWLLPATEARQAVLDHVRELVAAAVTVPDELEMVAVFSSNIAAIGYRALDKTLQVRFHSGVSYRYTNVPYYVWDSFMKSDSKGSFLNSEIKGQYETTKLD
jgi:hypothetical protein